MDKGILVIDMPECCNKCISYVKMPYPYNNSFCGINKHNIRAEEAKSDLCPLKPMPIKKPY